MGGRGRGCRYEKKNGVENWKGKEGAMKKAKRKILKSPTTTARQKNVRKMKNKTKKKNGERQKTKKSQSWTNGRN